MPQPLQNTQMPTPMPMPMPMPIAALLPFLLAAQQAPAGPPQDTGQAAEAPVLAIPTLPEDESTATSATPGHPSSTSSTSRG